MMKKMIVTIMVVAMIFGMMTMSSCSNKKDPVLAAIAGKTFVWEKEGLGGDFTITIKENNIYNYSEGPDSIYKGFGVWSLEDGILLLDERSGYAFFFRFDIVDGELVYRAKDSTNFLKIKVEDGDRFIPKK